MKRKTTKQIKELKKGYHMVAIKLDMLDYRYLQKMAKKEGRTISNMVRRIIAERINDETSAHNKR